jgi:SNF2 family DNA or RNA helicase
MRFVSIVQVLKELKSEHRVLLSGTPLQNNIAELFMLLHFLDKGKFANLEEFEDQFKDLSHEKQVGFVCQLFLCKIHRAKT